MLYDLQIKMRPGVLDDKDTIYGTWIASLSKTKIFKHFPPEYMYVMFNVLIDRIMNNSNVLVACDINDEDQIYGYVVYKDNTIYWIYVKYAFRQAYIGKRLLESSVGEYKERNVIWNTPPIKYLEKKWNLKIQPQKLLNLIS